MILIYLFFIIYNYLDKKKNGWRVFIINLVTSDYIKEKLIVPEREALIMAIKTIENMNIPNSKQECLFDKFIQKITNSIIYHIETGNLNSELDYIFNSINLLEDILISCEEESDLLKMQNLMNKLGVTKMVIFFFCNCDPKFSRIFEIMTGLSNKLLEGGNSEVQNTFYEYFMNNIKSSENFFAYFYKRIEFEINESYKDLSIYEIFEESFKKNSDFSYKLKKSSSIIEVLRFLQLLTENHNANMQVKNHKK